MNLERAILLVLLAANGDALSAVEIRRELPAFTRTAAALAEVTQTLNTLEESQQILGTTGDREDANGRAMLVYTLREKGRARALR